MDGDHPASNNRRTSDLAHYPRTKVAAEQLREHGSNHR
jgi:hypothetical protein